MGFDLEAHMDRIHFFHVYGSSNSDGNSWNVRGPEMELITDKDGLVLTPFGAPFVYISRDPHIRILESPQNYLTDWTTVCIRDYFSAGPSDDLYLGLDIGGRKTLSLTTQSGNPSPTTLFSEFVVPCTFHQISFPNHPHLYGRLRGLPATQSS